MTKLNELMQQLCPDGVEYRKLEDCCTVLDKKRKPVTKAAREAGEYPYYGANGIQDYVADYIFDGTFVLVGEDGSVITKAGTPVVTWAEGKIWVNNHAHIIEETDGVLLRYLFHYIQTIDVTPLIHGNIPKLTGGDFRALQIPVPPLPVQSEIVRILDNFTELTAELTSELTARKKQYEFYRDKLLTFGDVRGGATSDVVWRMLGEVCNLQSGKAVSAYLISDTQTAENPIPCYGANGLRGYVSTSNESGDKPIVGRQGALCGNICFATGSYYATEHAVVVTDKGFFNSRFLYHLLVNADLNQYKTAGAQPGLSVARLNEVKVPVPARTVQDRIANVLDNFDAICSDLKIGLPAEIEARQKQYEYYRDKLLTFKEAKA